jgi:predicted DNA binding CopG/RHH family protein
MEKVTITRKDGIKYERKMRKDMFDTSLHLRYHTSKIETLKEIANKKGIKYQELVREVIDKFIEKEQGK